MSRKRVIALRRVGGAGRDWTRDGVRRERPQIVLGDVHVPLAMSSGDIFAADGCRAGRAYHRQVAEFAQRAARPGGGDDRADVHAPAPPAPGRRRAVAPFGLVGVKLAEKAAGLGIDRIRVDHGLVIEVLGHRRVRAEEVRQVGIAAPLPCPTPSRAGSEWRQRAVAASAACRCHSDAPC